MSSCRQWLPATGQHCGEAARFYLTGWRCPGHTPAAQAGRAEPEPGPGYTPQRLPTSQAASALVDARAVASGKRRSTPQTYRLARVATGRGPENTTSSTSTRRTS
ncbi:hypothetical protein [Kitasatospora sp. MBT63]|uniref:hypothetical protein n=1 Tax=Kitasatospora sp. MBT63 TaxID=1444768 RepID=UPI00053A96BB|nr:hypothetical protein [Kitasatospora sp. MBT63]